MQLSIGLSNIEKYSMHQLLNFKASYQASKRMLCNFCTKWREERKDANPNAGTHGGITANHRELIKAILRILPVSFDWIKQHRPGVFKHCLKNNQLAIITTSMALRLKMSERTDEDETDPNDLVGRSTLFNLLDRLEDAGIIVSREPIVNPMDKNLKSMLIYLNMEAIALYNASDELTESQGEKAPSDAAPGPDNSFLDYYNTNIQSRENINNDLADVENVQPGGCDGLKSAEMVRCKGVSKITTKDFSAAAGSPAELLWKTCVKMLYDGQYFGIGTQAAAISMLEAHLDAAKKFVEQTRSDAIAAFCKTEKYLKKNEKERLWYLNEFFIKKQMPGALRDAQKTAFALVMEAIRIQAQAAKNHGFKTYYPTVFLSEDYGLKKYVQLAQKDLQKSCLSGVMNKSEQISIKNTLRNWLSTFAFMRLKDGVNFAVSRVDHYLKKAEKLLLDASFDNNLKESYYQYFRTQILATL